MEWDSNLRAQQIAERTLDFFNHRPINEGAFKVLYVGNSITVHPSRDGVWDSIQGMVATEPKYDFVHLFTDHLIQTAGVGVEIFLEAGPGVDHALARLETTRILETDLDLCVIQRGENDKKFTNQFRRSCQKLVELISIAC